MASFKDMANNSSSIKSSPSDILFGDIIINANDVYDVWGIVSKVDPEHKQSRVVYLTCGRITKFSTYGEKWIAYSPEEYASLMSNPIIIRDHMWKEIAMANMENDKDQVTHDISLFLYLLTLPKQVQIETDDIYEHHGVRSMVVAAYTSQSAKSIALTHDRLDDSQSAWKEQRNILCKTIGFGFVNKPQIISVSREDVNG
jgi:hypothetical protein